MFYVCSEFDPTCSKCSAAKICSECSTAEICSKSRSSATKISSNGRARIIPQVNSFVGLVPKG